jgi:hypothetical protein
MNVPPSGPIYRADGEKHNGFPEKWTPAIHMPRKYSRITLEIEQVRVERIQEINQNDAEAEGVVPQDWEGCPVPDYTGPFKLRWDALNEKRGFGWNANPFVWVLTFKRLA